MMSGPFYLQGMHEVEILEVAFTESQAGNTMIVCKVMVLAYMDPSTPGEAAPVAQQYERTIRLTVTENEDQQKFVLMKLRNLGWEGSKFEEVPDALTGQRTFAICQHGMGTGKYAGRQTEQWDFPLPPRESVPLESRPTLAKKLNALFAKSLKDAPKQAPKAKPVEQPAEVTASVADQDDPEIPF